MGLPIMANEKPNPLDILLDPGFGHEKSAAPVRAAAESRVAAPASEITVKVRIDDIQPYDQNPRRAFNPKYEEIRDSIRALGLRQQFSITKRPNDDFYVIQSGGNTRLKALKELYAETGEERFGLVECKFVPYTEEIDLLSLHIMENEQRSAMLFIDVAIAAKKIRTMIEEKSGKNISLRALEQALEARHCGIKYQNLDYYLYGAEIADLLPNAFSKGLGITRIRQVKKLESNVKRWAKEKNKDVNQAVQYFRSVLKEKDADSISVEEIEKKLLERLSDEFYIKYNDVRNAFIHIKDNGTLIDYHEDEAGQFNHEATIQPDNVQPKLNATTPLHTIHNDPIEPEIKASVNSPAITTDLADFKNFTPAEIIIPSSEEIENKGASPQEIQRNKLRHQLRDVFKMLIQKSHRFNDAFTLTDDDYILTSNLEPQEVNGTYDEDEVAAWHALHTRVGILRIMIDGREDLPYSRKLLFKLSDPNYLNAYNYITCMISSSFITQLTNILPEPLRKSYCNGFKPEIIEIFEVLPSLDHKLKEYLSYLT